MALSRTAKYYRKNPKARIKHRKSSAKAQKKKEAVRQPEQPGNPTEWTRRKTQNPHRVGRQGIGCKLFWCANQGSSVSEDEQQAPTVAVLPTNSGGMLFTPQSGPASCGARAAGLHR